MSKGSLFEGFKFVLPALLTVLANIFIFGWYASGWSKGLEEIKALRMQVANHEGRITRAESHMENTEYHMSASTKYATFVTRTEFDSLKAWNNDQISEIKVLIKEQNAKLDRVLERE